MTTTPVNTTATTQASPFGGGTKSAGAGGSKNGGADFLSFLDQMFGSAVAAGLTGGQAPAGAASNKSAGETSAGTEDLPPWLLAFSDTETNGTAGPPVTAETEADTPSSDNPIVAIGDDGTDANAILAGTVNPAAPPPSSQPPAQPDTSGQNAAAQSAVEGAPLPVTDKTVTAAVAATGLAAQANAKSGQAEASPEPATPTPAQATVESTGDPELDSLLATLARGQASQSAPGTQQQAAATGSEAEQLARAANPAAQAGEGQPRDGKTEKTRSPQSSNKADEAARPENRSSDALSRLLAAAQQNRSGAAIGDSAGNQDAQPFKPAVSAPVLLTINEVGTGTTAMTATATQALAATATAQIAQTAKPNMETLAVRIAQSAGAGTKSFEIELDPPELGRVEVRLEFSRDGRVSTHLTVDRSDTLDALMRDARGLERALQAQGLKLEDGGVQYQLRDQSSFAQQQGGRDAPEQSEPSGALDNQDTAPAIETGQSVTHQVALGGLDLRI